MMKRSKSHTQFDQLAGNTEVNNIFQFIERNKLVSDKKASQCTKTLANTKTPISVGVYVSCEWSTDIVVPVWLSIGLVRFD